MRSEYIRRFYVGELNFGFDSQHLSKEEWNKKNELYNRAILNGAIPLKEMKRVNNRFYESIYTIFYRTDDNRYLCLHNKELYGLIGEDYIHELMDFIEFLPKLDYYCPSSISFKNALNLFNRVANNKKLHYYSAIRDFKKYYMGTLEICNEILIYQKSYPYEKQNYNFNIMECIPLSNMYLKDGKSEVIDGKVHNFKIYKSIFYIVNDNELYNINNHMMYSKEETNTFDRVINLNHDMSSVFNKYNIDDGNTSISKMLKIQKKFLKDVDFMS